jgi:DNA-binding beta-propeller fold protein YncE
LPVDSQDRLYVADRSNSRIDVFDKDGKFLAAWKQFGRPSGIFVDRNDMLYVIDSQSSDNQGRRQLQPRLQARHSRRQRQRRQSAILHSAADARRSEMATCHRRCGRSAREHLRRLR